MKLKCAAELQETLASILESPNPSSDELQDVQFLLQEIGDVLIQDNRPDDAEIIISALDIVKKLASCEITDSRSVVSWLMKLTTAAGVVIRDGIKFEAAGYPKPYVLFAAQNFADEGVMNLDTEFEIDAAIYTEFFQRQGDNLETLETSLLDIESGKSAGDKTALMRFFHMIKGESALLGLEDISILSHKVEDLLQEVEPSACTSEMLSIKDWLERKFKAYAGNGTEPAPVAEMMALIDACDRSTAVSADPVAVVEDDNSDYYEVNALDGDVDLIQEFIAESIEHLDSSEAQLLTLESDPRNEEALNAVFRAFHSIKGVAGFIDMLHVQEFAHKSENLLDVARKGEIELSGPAMDLTFEAVDMIKTLIGDITDAIAGDGQIIKQPAYSDLLGKLVRYANGNIPGGNTVAAAGNGSPDQLLPTNVDVSAKVEPDAKGNNPEALKSTKTAAVIKKSAGAYMKEAVRVDADRLDLLVETIGELVIAEAMVSQNRNIRSSQSMESLRNLEHLDKICRELQQLGMSLRMVPVRPTFQKMARLVRDLSKKSGRQINFKMEGEDTELDKTVVDKISDPLVHLLRNAVDHGIEATTQERLAAGKTREGNIELRAYHKGGNICIDIQDDGKGLDRDVILQKAIDRGLVRDGSAMNDREVFNLIFEPGFTTALQVTEVSGRGVGLDVVRRNIEGLHGMVDITSRRGHGSIFSFRLPLTLAIIDGMVVRVGSENYIIPTLAVVRLIRPRQSDYSTVLEKGEMLRFENELIPMFRLNKMFKIPDAKSQLGESVVIVVESDGRQVGLMADNIVGQQQIVIKNLGKSIQGTLGITGGAIMSNGNVALILDIAGLVKVAHAHGGTRCESEAGNR